MMVASVMMKEDKKTKIKTFRAGYAWRVTAFFCTDGFAVSSDGYFFAVMALQCAVMAFFGSYRHFKKPSAIFIEATLKLN